MPTTPPTITPLPDPPDPNDRSTFNTRAYPWSVAQQTLATEVGAVAANVYANAGEAATSATTATTQAGIATTQASAAAAAAVTAVNAPGTSALSTTSRTIGLGPVAFTIPTDKLFFAGQPVVIAYRLSPTTKYMAGMVSSHVLGSGSISINVLTAQGTGETYADWEISIGAISNTVSSMPRIARTSNTALTVAEKGKLIDVTSGTFTQTTDSAATLTADWFAYLTNTGTGVVTFGTLALVQGAMVKLQSDGTTVRAYPERLPEQVTIVRDEKTSGTSGGTPGSTGAWLTRSLTTTPVNGIVGASLTSNEITLPAGSYLIEGSAPAYKADGHKARLYNVTAGTTAIAGTVERSLATESQQTRSHIRGPVTLASTSVLRVEHMVGTATSNGFGTAYGATGIAEVYTELTIRRISA